MYHWLRTFVLCIICSAFSWGQITHPAPRVKVFEVTPPTEPWKGWETDLIDEDPSPIQLPPEKYTSFPTPAGSAPIFSGKVVGLQNYNNVEVAIVSVFGREYLNNPAYEWVQVRPDGSFNITSSRLLNRSKTLVVRPPGGPWTFLRHDFPVGESARDIELRPQPGRSILVHAQVNDGPERTWMTVEAFDGYQRRDDQGQPALSEYHGGWQSNDGAVRINLPPRPMALRVRAIGSANGCVIVDPREVDEIVVKLPIESRLRVRVVQNGQVATGKVVMSLNPLARLSLAATETDGNGYTELGGLMPGPYWIIVDDQRFQASLKSGESTGVVVELKE